MGFQRLLWGSVNYYVLLYTGTSSILTHNSFTHIHELRSKGKRAAAFGSRPLSTIAGRCLLLTSKYGSATLEPIFLLWRFKFAKLHTCRIAPTVLRTWHALAAGSERSAVAVSVRSVVIVIEKAA